MAKATNIVDSLSGDTVSGYRALWNYLAGCAAYHLGKLSNRDEFLQTAFDRFVCASKASGTVSWFARLPHELEINGATVPEMNYLTIVAGEAISEYLTSLGTTGAKFERSIQESATLIGDTDADMFDNGLTELGNG